MKLILSPGGSVNWDSTRAAAVTSATFAAGTRDFGAGTENWAKCPGCDRELPTATMHLDHILAQARYTMTIDTSSTQVEIRDAASPHAILDDYLAGFDGGRLTVVQAPVVTAVPTHGYGTRRGGTQRTILNQQEVHTATAWACDLENLQFLCNACNTSKGAKDFDQVFMGRATRPLL